MSGMWFSNPRKLFFRTRHFFLYLQQRLITRYMKRLFYLLITIICMTCLSCSKSDNSGVAKKWGGKMPAVINLPVYDGDGVRPNGDSFDDACKGCYVFTASSGSERPPQVVDSALNPIIDKNTVYSGCYARVNVSFFPYDAKGRRGIGCGLNAVQFVADGEPLGTTVSVADAFGAPDTGIAAGAPANTVTGAPQIDPLTGMPDGV